MGGRHDRSGVNEILKLQRPAAVTHKVFLIARTQQRARTAITSIWHSTHLVVPEVSLLDDVDEVVNAGVEVGGCKTLRSEGGKAR